jgi:2-aminoethylphosphonate-pyruvate transaminase
MPASLRGRDRLLFTPGPLTTSLTVKQAMLQDAGSWHSDFNALVASVRAQLLQIAGVSLHGGWEAILLQGSGTFGVEAVFQSGVPPQGHVAVLSNGAYGERIGQMLQHARITHTMLRTPEHIPNDPETLDAHLRDHPDTTHVAVVHCETTTGILNPVAEIGRVTKRHGKRLVVDAMSSFGGLPMDLEGWGVDFLVSSANKCLEGVPGFSFVLCRRSELLKTEGWARSLSLDLLGQLRGFEKNGQFRYTPPTHAILAFHQALAELEDEGGVPARAARYRENHKALMTGMQDLSFAPFLPPAVQSPIITAFPYPPLPGFDFRYLYDRLADRGFIIYPGKLTQVNTFRIGTIGRLFPTDLEQLAHAIGLILTSMPTVSATP